MPILGEASQIIRALKFNVYKLLSFLDYNNATISDSVHSIKGTLITTRKLKSYILFNNRNTRQPVVDCNETSRLMAIKTTVRFRNAYNCIGCKLMYWTFNKRANQRCCGFINFNNYNEIEIRLDKRELNIIVFILLIAKIRHKFTIFAVSLVIICDRSQGWMYYPNNIIKLMI